MIHIKTHTKMFCKDIKPGDKLVYCIQNNCYAVTLGKSTIKDNGIFCTRFQRKVKKLVLSDITEDRKHKELEPGIHDIIGKEYVKCSECYSFNSFNSGEYEVFKFT